MPANTPKSSFKQKCWKCVTVFSNLLKSIWLFFPSILFILMVMFIFLGLGQGKDVILTFLENATVGSTIENVWKNVLLRASFFMAIGFWVYVSWYSSRIIAYMKKYQQLGYLQQFDDSLTEDKCSDKYELRNSYLDHFPRLIGYACFLVLILSLLNLIKPLWFTAVSPFLILFACLIILWIFDNKFVAFSEKNPALVRKLFNISGILFFILLIVFQFPMFHSSLATIFILLLLAMVVYFFYINLRRKELQKTVIRQQLKTAEDKGIDKFLKKIMVYLNVPPEEVGYFKWFNIFAAIGLVIYIIAVLSYRMAVHIGPFPIVLLAFAILLGFGNLITMFSVKTKVNLHFIIFILAAILWTPENHFVRTSPIKASTSFSYKNRQSIDQHFITWLRNHPDIDSVSQYPVYFVLANGGASRSGYWVASVLSRLEDSTIVNTPDNRFSKHIYCLSGTSGGGVGVAAFFSLLMHADGQSVQPRFEVAAKNYLKQDFLSYTLARMFGADYFNYIPGINYFLHYVVKLGDRNEALETGFESCTDTSYYKMHFDSTYIDQCVTQQNQYSSLPVLCINTTRVQDGNPGVICTIKLNNPVFNKRVDVLSLLPDSSTMHLSTASLLGARFPYISPAGRIDEMMFRQRSELDKKDSGAFNKINTAQRVKDSSRSHYFVDGGYFDNSGAGVVQEMITGILHISDTIKDNVLRSRMKKLKLVVLHITNSPQGDITLKKLTPFRNDLSAPMLTILGAYDMQTTVNDRRLASFVKDITPGKDSISAAQYYPVHLYNDPSINADTLARGPYAMNWFISDSVLHQMDKRLEKQPRLQQLINLLKTQ